LEALWPKHEAVSMFNAYNWEQGREEMREDSYMNYVGTYADVKRKLTHEDLKVHIYGNFACIGFL
jgi:hypothetical protein